MARPYPCRQQVERQFCFLSPLDEHRRLLPDLQASVVLQSHAFTALPPVHSLADMLTARYGGYRANWMFTPIDDALLLRVPDWLSPEDLILDEAYWEREHYFLIRPWNALSRSEPLPNLLRVRLTIRGFPLDFCHPWYYRQATSSMGCLTGVDREVLTGQHRSFIRVFMTCPDLRLIPLLLIVGHDGKWTTCQLEVEVQAGQQQQALPPPPQPPQPQQQAQQHALQALVGLLDEGPEWHRMLQERVPFLRNTDTEGAPAAAQEEGTKEGSDRCMRGITAPVLPRGQITVQGLPPDNGQQTKNKLYLPPMKRMTYQSREACDGYSHHKVIKGGENTNSTMENYGTHRLKQQRNLGQLEAPHWRPKENGTFDGAQRGRVETIRQITTYHVGHSSPKKETLMAMQKSGRPEVETNIKASLNTVLPHIITKVTPSNTFPSHTLTPKQQLAMESLSQEDEALIRRFIGLNTDDQPSKTIELPHRATTSIDWDRSLLARVITDKTVLETSFQTAMLNAWRANPNIGFKPVARNCFLVEFIDQADFATAQN